MKKQHLKPEFTVIRQNEANAKFFVASGEDFTNNPSGTPSSVTEASQYDLDSNGLSM